MTFLPFGQINSFGLSSHSGNHGSRGQTLTFALDPLITGLRVNGAWSPDQLEIHFVPSGGAVSADEPLIEIDGMRVDVGERVK